MGDEEKYAGYTMAFKDGKSVAGIMQSTENGNGHPDLWTTYLGVDSIAKSFEGVKNAVATNAGAVFYLRPMDVPDQGKTAMVGDQGGASRGLWEFSAHTGFQVHQETGAATWHELHTKAPDAAVQFYVDVFGLQSAFMSDTPEFRFTCRIRSHGSLIPGFVSPAIGLVVAVSKIENPQLAMFRASRSGNFRLWDINLRRTISCTSRREHYAHNDLF